MPLMKSKVSHTYAGKEYKQGDEFDCDEKFVHLLRTIGRAELAEGGNKQITGGNKQNYQTTAMTAGSRNNGKTKSKGRNK